MNEKKLSKIERAANKKGDIIYRGEPVNPEMAALLRVIALELGYGLDEYSIEQDQSDGVDNFLKTEYEIDRPDVYFGAREVLEKVRRRLARTSSSWGSGL